MAHGVQHACSIDGERAKKSAKTYTNPGKQW